MLINHQIEGYLSKSDAIKNMYWKTVSIPHVTPDNPYIGLGTLSVYLEAAGIEEIRELAAIDEFISEHSNNIDSFLSEIINNRLDGNDWWLNAAFLCRLVLILKYPDIFKKEFLEHNDFKQEIAEIVLNAAKSFSQAIAAGS